MTFRRSNRDLGRSAAAWLATCLVVLGGTLACLVVIFAGAGDPLPGLVSFAGCLLGVSLLRLMREKPTNEVRRQHSLWLLRRPPAPPRVSYQVRKQTTKPSVTGTNTPPTAQEIRELADGLHNWVPARTASRTGSTSGPSAEAR